MTIHTNLFLLLVRPSPIEYTCDGQDKVSEGVPEGCCLYLPMFLFSLSRLCSWLVLSSTVLGVVPSLTVTSLSLLSKTSYMS